VIPKALFILFFTVLILQRKETKQKQVKAAFPLSLHRIPFFKMFQFLFFLSNVFFNYFHTINGPNKQCRRSWGYSGIPLAKLFWTKLVRFGQIWLDLGEI